PCTAGVGEAIRGRRDVRAKRVDVAGRCLAFSRRAADIRAGGWRWTSHSPTGSGPEGSSPNERGSGRSSASHSLMQTAATRVGVANGNPFMSDAANHTDLVSGQRDSSY